MSNQFLSTAIESAEGVIAFSLDRDYCYTSYTSSHFETMKKIWGIEISLGSNLLELLNRLNPDDTLKAKTNFDKALAGENLTVVEEYGDKKYVRSFWENRYSPIFNEKKDIVGVVIFVLDVSNLSFLHLKVKDANDRLGLALKAAKVGIWEWNMLTNEIFWSDEILTLFNLDESFRNLTFDEYLKYVHPDDVSVLLLDIDNAIKNKDNYLTEHRVIPPDGKQRWILGAGKVIVEDGKPTKLIGTVADISNQKKSEIDAKESYSLLQAAMESTANGLLVVDMAGQISIYNNRFLEIFGFNENETRNQPDEVLLSKAITKISDPEKFLAKVNELYATPEAESNDFIKLINGTILHRYSKPQKLSGKVVGRVWSFRDITEQKKTEQSLFKSELLYRTLTDNMSDFINLTDTTGKIIYLSPSTKLIMGDTYPNLIGTSVFDFVHPEDKQRVFEKFKTLLIERKSVNAEVRYKKENGDYIWLETNGNPIFNEIGWIETIVLTSRDITERKQNERKIIDQNTKLSAIADALKNKNDQLEEFTQIVSHNLRSPVSNILSLLDFYEQSTDEGEKKKFIKMLRESGSKMLTSLHELNEVLKIKQDKDIPRMELVFEHILEGVKKQLSSQIAEAKAVISTDFGSAPTVSYPNIYLESVLMNLLSNALKYKHPDRNSEINLTSTVENDTVILRVVDNGLGIDLKRYGHHIFKLRKTFHKHPESRGIGLFMIKNQIEALGGEITISSEENIGTVFTVKLGK
jgi:PAS domain S-box-containing protein